MSLNTAHQGSKVLTNDGEFILLFSDRIIIEWVGQQNAAFKGKKQGRIYLTNRRMIFLNKVGKDAMKSFSFPFDTLSELGLEQPVFGTNFLKGIVCAQPDGSWQGEAEFKILFKGGGSMNFAKSLIKAAHVGKETVQAGFIHLQEQLQNEDGGA